MEHGGRLTRQARKSRRQEPMESSAYKETLAPAKTQSLAQTKKRSLVVLPMMAFGPSLTL